MMLANITQLLTINLNTKSMDILNKRKMSNLIRALICFLEMQAYK